MMLLVSHLSLSQSYPKTKIINGDTVVLLLKSQADDINTKFNNYNETINTQKAKIDSLFLLGKVGNKAVIDSLKERLEIAITANNQLFGYNEGLKKAFEDMSGSLDSALMRRAKYIRRKYVLDKY
jgi:Skp family chaperone for outer membrane proteins